MKPILITLSDALTIIETGEAKTGLLKTLALNNLSGPQRLAFVNAHAANMCHRNAEFLTDLLASETILRDGAGMKILFKMLGREPGLNLNGTDFIPDIIDFYRGRPVALMGTSEDILENAGFNLRSRGTHITVAVNGFQDEQTYVRLAKETRPALIILAMGMPKQERVAAILAEQLNHPCLIVCGGAVLDFMGGKVNRAPAIMRKSGLEWLFRLINEPKRLFGRYVIGNTTFLIRCAFAVLGRKSG
jgi:N-acetylglucosaminyldiphosphoundecaprenol N-acetyl-beta-D-mannosaminyltransferase